MFMMILSRSRFITRVPNNSRARVFYVNSVMENELHCAKIKPKNVFIFLNFAMRRFLRWFINNNVRVAVCKLRPIGIVIVWKRPFRAILFPRSRRIDTRILCSGVVAAF